MQYYSIVDYLRKQDKKRDGKGIATEFDGKKITRDEYWEIINHYKAFFLRKGFFYGCQKKVTICNLNVPEYEFIYNSLLELGVVVSTVSLSFFLNDIKRETIDKGAETIVLSAEYISNDLKKALKELENGFTNIKRIIFTSAGDYRSEEKERLYEKNHDFKKDIDFLELSKNIEIIYPSQIKQLFGIQGNFKEKNEPVNFLELDATYSNTAGTSTGVPKCAVHTHQAVINLFKAHEKHNFPQFEIVEGDKTLLLIPISHITSQYYSLLLRRAIGANIVYNPEAFEPSKIAKILIENEINDVVAPFGLYVALANSPLKKGDLKHLKPSCGGEATPFNPTKLVNERLVWAHSRPIVIGGGSTEFGSVTMTAFGIEDRINETGRVVPGVEALIINPLTMKEAPHGERGILYKRCGWQMKGYLNDNLATQGFYNYINKNGDVYGTNNDIGAVVREYEGDPVYLLSGRATDFVMPNSKTNRYFPGVNIVEGKVSPVDFKKGSFLFDMEDKLLEIPGIIESEALLIPHNNNDREGVPVVNVVVAPNVDLIAILKEVYNLYFLQDEFVPEGLIFRTNFARSLASDKRETASLKNERSTYYWMNKKGEVIKIKILENGEIIKEVEEDLKNVKRVKPPEPQKLLKKRN